jgi:hypothetical protein
LVYLKSLDIPLEKQTQFMQFAGLINLNDLLAADSGQMQRFGLFAIEPKLSLHP